MTETIAEIAEREAAAAEAEPDTPDNPEPEPDPEPEPEPTPEPASDVAVEKRFKQIDAEANRHSKRVAEIMGDDFAGVEPCPCCQISGFVFPFQHDSPDDAYRRGMVEQYFGTASLKRKAHPHMQRCELCDGQGFLDSGSQREEYADEQCEKCAGRGSIRTDVQGPQVVSLPVSPPNGQAAEWTPPDAPPAPRPYWDYADSKWKLP